MKIGQTAFAPGRPALMGIVNVTPDSFSDGGRFLAPSAAIDHALRLIGEGADLLDIGAESTRPGAQPVSEAEELARLLPVVEAIRRESTVPISIDTTKAAVATRMLDAGATMINDVSAGRFDPGMLRLAAERGVPICLMHMQGTPRTMQEAPAYGDVVGEIRSFLGDAIERARAEGVALDKILIDPGIGFGKTVGHNLEILARLGDLLALGPPIVIGTSRKAFIGKILNVDIEKRLEGTLATLSHAIDHGASVLRIHDVGAARRFVDMYLACSRVPSEKGAASSGSIGWSPLKD